MDWWMNLGVPVQVLYCIAVPATVILVIQVIMLLVGFGGGGEGVNFSDTSGLDVDFSELDGGSLDIPEASDIDTADGSAPGDFSLMSLFSLQSVVAFLTVFGWLGIVLIGNGLGVLISIIIAFAAGFAAMYGVAKILHLSSKLVQNGTLNLNVLLGEIGTVYLPIPPKGSGTGKITVQLSERFLELSAVSDDTSIENNASVRIIDILPGNILVVEKII